MGNGPKGIYLGKAAGVSRSVTIRDQWTHLILIGYPHNRVVTLKSYNWSIILMARAARLLEAIIGLFFVVTAAMKAVDVEAFAVQISTYGVIKDPELLVPIAYGVIGLETLIGVFLIAGLRFGWFVYGGAAILTVAFSVLIVYAWQVKGIDDCGCFGKFVTMTPQESLIKNAFLFALLLVAWAGTRNVRHHHDGYRSHWPLRLITAFLSLVVVGGILYGDYANLLPGSQTADAVVTPAPVAQTDPERPFAQFTFSEDGQQYNLGEGEYLVVFLSATCDHCRASVAKLNEYNWQDGLPKLVALMQADSKAALDDFRLVTEPLFPTQPIKDLVFQSFLEGAPPALFHVINGKMQQTWTWEAAPPEPAEVQAAIGEKQSAG